MKIFANGKYSARISKISYGVSELKKTPYFLCRFQDNDRFIEERFYQTENSKYIIKKLFEAVGLNNNDFTPEKLIDKYLEIEVTSGNKVNKNGIPFSFSEVKRFWKITSNKYYCDDIFDDFEELNDVGWTATVFWGRY